jgi:protocatechuate 3,4-dioxygenase beta subunit
MVEFSRVVPEAEEAVLDFEIPTGRVSGSVQDDAGRPLPGVRVSLHPEGALETGTFWGGQYVESTSDAQGRYDIQGLRPGRYSLMAGGMAYGGMLSEKADFGRQVKSVAIEEGRWLEGQDFKMERAGTLAVRVVDAAGQPVAQASVFVRDAGGRLLDRLSLISTDASGACTYGGVAPGAFTLSARKGELSSRESEPVRVDSGGTTAVELRMEHGTILIVTLEGESGELLRANVSVQDEDGREVSGMVALSDIMAALGKGFTSEEHRVGPLPPGRYRVSAELSDGRSVKVTLTGKAERKLNLRFD